MTLMCAMLTLDVGGDILEVEREVLDLIPYFAAMFRFQTQCPVPIFVDRCGHKFQQVLRTVTQPDWRYPLELTSELEFYGLRQPECRKIRTLDVMASRDVVVSPNPVVGYDLDFAFRSPVDSLFFHHTGPNYALRDDAIWHVKPFYWQSVSGPMPLRVEWQGDYVVRNNVYLISDTDTISASETKIVFGIGDRSWSWSLAANTVRYGTMQHGTYNIWPIRLPFVGYVPIAIMSRAWIEIQNADDTHYRIMYEKSHLTADQICAMRAKKDWIMELCQTLRTENYLLERLEVTRIMWHNRLTQNLKIRRSSTSTLEAVWNFDDRDFLIANTDVMAWQLGVGCVNFNAAPTPNLRDDINYMLTSWYVDHVALHFDHKPECIHVWYLEAWRPD